MTSARKRAHVLKFVTFLHTLLFLNSLLFIFKDGECGGSQKYSFFVEVISV